jgi:hypothetical protein
MSIETQIPVQSFIDMDERLFKTYLMAMRDRAKELKENGKQGNRRRS